MDGETPSTTAVLEEFEVSGERTTAGAGDVSFDLMLSFPFPSVCL